MALTNVDKIDDACPSVSVWTAGTPAGAPDTGTEATFQECIDIGSVNVSGGDANTDAIGVSVEFQSTFDDSVYYDATWGAKVRVWCANKPLNTLNKIFAEFDSTATLPAVSLSAALTSGVEIPGDPYAPLEGDAAIYDATNKRIAWLLLQLQATQTGNVDFDQAQQIHGAPVVYWMFPRMDPNVTRLQPNDFSMDTEAGHMFVYTDVQLFIEDENGNYALVGGGKNINSIKEDTIEIETTEEHIMWEKAKPTVTYQTARTSLVSGINFKLDQCVPAIEALAHQTAAEDDTTQGTVKYSVNAKSSRTTEKKYVIMFRSHGGFVCLIKVNRGILTKSGAMTPGATEFAGKTYNIKCLASGIKRETVEISYTNVATEVAFAPAVYDVATV